MKLFFVFAVVACLLAMCCQGQVETRLSPQQQSQIEELNAALVATRLEVKNELFLFFIFFYY